MTDQTDEMIATNTYELTCTDCSFSTTVRGTPFDALEEADAHQSEHGRTTVSHFVNFNLSPTG